MKLKGRHFDEGVPPFETYQNGAVYTDSPRGHVGESGHEDDPQTSVKHAQKKRKELAIYLNKPRAQFSLIILEASLVLIEIAISVTALRTHAWGSRGGFAAAVGIAFWTYLLVLCLTRLLFRHTTKSRFPNLWYHNASLYGVQWILVTLRFRSFLIHHRLDLPTRLVIADFCISTVLEIIALTSRKGNRTIAVEYEDDLEPSREPLANLFSMYTYSWVDPIIWRGYWKTLELSDVWNIAANDKAAVVLTDFRQLRKTSSLAWHLMKYFKKSLLVQAAWSVASGLVTFAPTLLLKAFLEFVEDPKGIPVNAAWFYIILLAMSTCFKSVTDGQALWIGRKICIRLRAVMVGEIFAKALRRKAASVNDTVLGEKKKQVQPPIKPKINKGEAIPNNGSATTSGRQKGPGHASRTQNATDAHHVNGSVSSKPNASDEASDSQVNVGTIINLMAVDTFKVAEISAYLHYVWGVTPVQLILCIILLYRILGWSAIASIIIMILVLPLNMYIAQQFQKKQKKVMAATDVRIHTTNEILQNIRIIKYFAWEPHFGKLVSEKRKTELAALRNKYILWTLAATIWSSVPILVTFLSFLLYTVIEQRPLIPSVAFSALSLFSILRYPLDQLADMIAHVQESKVSVDRVEEFLNEEETEKYEQIEQGAKIGDGTAVIGLTKATLSWGGKSPQNDIGRIAFRLIDMNVQFHVDRLNIIAGPTGSGKTSLLMALLGEMTLLEGSVYLPGGLSREDLRPDPGTGLTNSIAYCAQQAWLVNDSIKENILFAAPFDETRYRSVLAACALERDLEILDGGDATLVGEKGITLSGGQKQRISLARALYSSSRHVLLDDCLSAVDSHTAKHIFEHCILGPLMFGRTCILVTHNVLLCVPRSHFVVVLNNGKISSQGLSTEVMASGALGDELARSRPGSKGVSQIQSRADSTTDLNDQDQTPVSTNQGNGHASGAMDEVSKSQGANPNSGIGTETKATGSVNIRVIGMYLSAMGPWPYWVFAVLAFALQQAGSLAANIWVRAWSNSYTSNVQTSSANSQDPRTYYIPSIGFSSQSFSISGTFWGLPIPAKSAPSSPRFRAFGARDDVDDWYYLSVYALLGLFYCFMSMFREGYIFWGSLRASRKLHYRLLDAVTRAKIQFFDTTPLGQLMNRFSKDVEAIDQDVSPTAAGVLSCLASLISIVLLISAITPGFLVAGFFIALLYYAIGSFYLRSSRDLKRLESVLRSPIYQQFGEALSGVVTIRAYGDQKRFIRDNQHRVDTQNRPFYFLWATNRWLSLRVDFGGALVAFFAGVFIIVNIKTIDAGSAGLSLTYAVMFTENILWLVRLYANNEQNMNSVERVKEYVDVDQEAQAIIENSRPPGNWPSKGEIEFVKYSTRYRPDLEPVLKDLSFTIQPGERVGIVGRTGAGKSSLALALFRGLEAMSGRIIIDEVDIATIGLRDLREAITIVPQDPTLFTGTIRSNLDPFGLFTDQDIFATLRRVQLIDSPDTSSSSPSTSIATTAVHHPSETAASSPPPSSFPAKPLTPQLNLPPSQTGDSDDEETTSLAKIATNTIPGNKNPFLNLSHPVAESGSNLSQGQRQLLCLARALLKSPRLLIMDEATASIDYATDTAIQSTLRASQATTSPLDKSTIITIAHRLQTIADYDKVLVLDKGSVVEWGPPWELVTREGGMFRGMCEMSGDGGEGVLEMVIEAGRVKKAAGELVDVGE